MAKGYKYSSTQARLQPVAATVIFTALAVAAILLGSVGMKATPVVDGAYEINAGG